MDSGLSKLDVDFPYWYNYVIPFIHFVKVLNKIPFLILEHIENILAFFNHLYNLHGCHHLGGKTQGNSEVSGK